MENNKEKKINEAFWAVKKAYADFNFKASAMIIVAAIEELQRNNQECYLTNEQFAHYTKESVSSVRRLLDILEEHNIIKRTTTTIKGKVGKQRAITLNPMIEWTIPIVYPTYPKKSQQINAT